MFFPEISPAVLPIDINPPAMPMPTIHDTGDFASVMVYGPQEPPPPRFMQSIQGTNDFASVMITYPDEPSPRPPR